MAKARFLILVVTVGLGLIFLIAKGILALIIDKESSALETIFWTVCASLFLLIVGYGLFDVIGDD